MKRVLLDTSAYSAFFRRHPQAIDQVQLAAEIVLCPIVLGELEAGFLKGSKTEDNRRLLRQFLLSSRVRTVEIDDETATRFGLIVNSMRLAGTPIPTNDVWIAAVAMQHGLHVVTLDRHFSKVREVSAVVLTG